MSKGRGDVRFNKNTLVKMDIFAKDVCFECSEDEIIHFYTGDRFFYLNSESDDRVTKIRVGKLRGSGTLTNLGDLTVQVPKNIKLAVSIAKGDFQMKGLFLHSFELSIALGDVNIRDVNCKSFDISSTKGDIEAVVVGESFKFNTTSGDMDLHIKGRPDKINLNALKGDILLRLDTDVKILDISSILGDRHVNGKAIDHIEGNGITRVYINSTKGDIDVIYPTTPFNETKEHSDEIKKILEMLKEKKINSQQAAKLLDSLQTKREVL